MEKTLRILVALLVVGALVAMAGCTGDDACAEEKDQNAKNKCYFDKAVADKTPDLCEQITNNDLKKDCADQAK